ncbi:MAG: hypothetical protein ACOY6K_12580 [Pseudomonadota bacterium]
MSLIFVVTLAVVALGAVAWFAKNWKVAVTSDANKLGAPNPWHPITDSIDLKHLGKFAEELNECGSAVARCIIQGVNECEPVTGKRNRDWLQDEIADVIANAQLVIDHFKLDSEAIHIRAARKQAHLKAWHDLA